MMPFYFSIFPYAVFHILSREMHTILGIQWFTSIMAISLQVGDQENVKFLFIIYILFTGMFASMSAVLNTAFTSETASKFLMATPIKTSWPQDITSMVMSLI
jgi:hypothetical protein